MRKLFVLRELRFSQQLGTSPAMSMNRRAGTVFGATSTKTKAKTKTKPSK
jgi:hypothetical protein